jgi:hypothetical protein
MSKMAIGIVATSFADPDDFGPYLDPTPEKSGSGKCSMFNFVPVQIFVTRNF